MKKNGRTESEASPEHPNIRLLHMGFRIARLVLDLELCSSSRKVSCLNSVSKESKPQ